MNSDKLIESLEEAIIEYEEYIHDFGFSDPRMLEKERNILLNKIAESIVENALPEKAKILPEGNTLHHILNIRYDGFNDCLMRIEKIIKPLRDK